MGITVNTPNQLKPWIEPELLETMEVAKEVLEGKEYSLFIEADYNDGDYVGTLHKVTFSEMALLGLIFPTLERLRGDLKQLYSIDWSKVPDGEKALKVFKSFLPAPPNEVENFHSISRAVIFEEKGWDLI